MTMGSTGSEGRPFLEDLHQASSENLRGAFLGGIVFNLANILLTAAIAGAGMAVAFPIGIGLALVIGVIINYVLLPKGDPTMLFGGVALIVLAILVNAFAYKMKNAGNDGKASMKWIFISVVAGILMSVFYPFVASGMDLENFVSPAVGKMTPYTAFVVFSTGILISNLLFNSLLMKQPLEGAPITYKEYFAGGLSIHVVGVLGGFIWALGFLFNLIYVLFNLLYENDYLVTFGGLEKFIFSVDSSSEGTGLNMFDFVYVSVGILFLYIIVGLIIMYGLSIKDILKKGGGGIKLVVPIVAIFIICFSLFFSIFFFRDFYMNSMYFITGSMLFIYGSNIFNRKSWFLKIN